jgi:dihydropyrimidinase
MLHGSDYTPYEGLEVVGWPITTLLRGNVIAEGGAVVGHAGDGKFLKRTIAQPF